MYKRPSYNIKTTGVFTFKTKDKDYILKSYHFERENDTEDSLEIQDELRGEIGSIRIKNSAWNKLAKGETIIAKTSKAKGDITGRLTRIDDINNSDKYEKGGDMNEYSKGGNVIERRYVNKDEDYETRYAKNRPSRMGYKDERKFEGGGEMGEFAYGSTETLKVELANNLRDLQGMNKVMRNNDMPKSYVGDAMRLQARNEDLVKELKHRGVNINSILYKEYDKFAVGGEIGNTVSFKGDYGTPRSGVIKEKRGSSYIVATDDGDRLVDSYEVISFSETPVAKKKRFGFFEGGGSIEEYKQAERDYDKYGEYLEDAIEDENEADIKKYKRLMDEAETKMHRYERKYAGGGEIENKIEKLKKVVSSKMLPESVKAKAQSEIDKLEKELHESKETKAEEKAEHKAGGKEYKSKLEENLEKELHRLQRDLNSSRLQTYNEGDNSEEEKARQRERTSKIIRMNEVLALLNEIEIGKENKMTGESEGERNVGMDNEARLDEKEELNATIQKLYDIEAKAEDLINYQSGGIQGQSVDKIKKYVEYVNKEVSKLKVPFGSEVFEVLEDENAHSLNLTLGLLGFYKNAKDSGEWAKKHEQYTKVVEVVNEVKGGGKPEAKKPTTTSKKEVVGYAIVDPISGEIVVSKKTIRQLIEASKKLEKTKGFEDMGDLAYEIIKKDDKNVLGDKIESVDIKLLPIGKKPTTRKAPVKKAVVKKVEGLKPKFKVGDVVLVNYGEEEGKSGKILEAYYYEEYPQSMKPTDTPYYEIEGTSKDISENNLELYKAPKADHKKLVAKLKAKKGATPSNEPSKGHKRSESSDRKRSALPLGKRVSADGNVYYENRLNRADISKEDKFEKGGEVKGSDWGLNLNW